MDGPALNMPRSIKLFDEKNSPHCQKASNVCHRSDAFSKSVLLFSITSSNNLIVWGMFSQGFTELSDPTSILYDTLPGSLGLLKLNR